MYSVFGITIQFSQQPVIQIVVMVVNYIVIILPYQQTNFGLYLPSKNTKLYFSLFLFNIQYLLQTSGNKFLGFEDNSTVIIKYSKKNLNYRLLQSVQSSVYKDSHKRKLNQIDFFQFQNCLFTLASQLRIISFYTLNMDFWSNFYSLFSGEAILHNTKKNQQKTMMQPNQVSKLQSSLFKNKPFESCLQESQFKNSSNSLIDNNFPSFFQLIKIERVTLSHFGDLVGFVGKQVSFLKIQNENTIIRVGKTSQINSVGAIRKNSLDSLIVCYDQDGCQFELQQIFLAQQRLIFVVQSEAVLKTILKKLQTIISQIFTDQPLSQSCSSLCIEIAKYQNRYFIQFKDGAYFYHHFENELRKINIQLSNKQQYLALIKKITLKDYLDVRLGKSSVKAKILTFQKEIKLYIQKSRKKQQELRMIKFYEHLSENEQQQVNVQPKRKNSSFEADIQAEYFKIRASEKKTGQTEIQEQIDTDLFYLIQERDSSCNQDKSEEKPLRLIPKHNPKKDKPRQRSKSEHCIEITRSQDLDDQFFTKQ